MVLSPLDQQIIAAIQEGIAFESRPFATIAANLSLSEDEVIQRIEGLQENGVIKRFGAVVRHHELGYNANAMVVWNIPDEQVDAAGKKLGEFDCITLCYRRPRRLPLWPYNLFTMIHGRSRDSVMQALQQITAACELQNVERDILFSGRRFRQRGARYL